jgi:dGTPase
MIAYPLLLEKFQAILKENTLKFTKQRELVLKFLYDNVYRSPQVHKDFEKAKKILSELYYYFLDNKALRNKKLSDLYISGGNNQHQSSERIVCDLIASMTDRYAMNLYKNIFFPIADV